VNILQRRIACHRGCHVLPAFPSTRFEARSEAGGFDLAILQRFGGRELAFAAEGVVLQGWFVGRNVGQVLIRAASQ
jgi:hypothetical protein